MKLENDTELENTRKKLKEVEERYELRKQETTENPFVQQLTLQSLKKVINQLKEQIAIYEAHRGGKKPAEMRH